ncbi:MAG: hypothetical protein IKZ43_04070 [Acidaminococcaceae bacterium]|nr:hypothetical protein [Acidaminococcaceae bacterium]
MSIKELDSRVTTLRELQSEIERLTAEVEAIKDSIKAEMVNRGEETLTGNGWKASWKVIESSRLDGKALKAAMPEIAARFTVSTRTSRFTVN